MTMPKLRDVNGSAPPATSTSADTPMNDPVKDFLANIFSNTPNPQPPQGPRGSIPNTIPADRRPVDIAPRFADTAEPIRAAAMAPEPTVDPDLPLPQHLLYGTGPESLGFSVSTVGLQKMPASVLRTLALMGSQNGVVVMMRNYSQVELMHRLKSFLDTGKYHPWDPLSVLEYIDEHGITKPWNYKKEYQLRAVKVTQNTQDLFKAELELYFFAIELGYDDLRRESAANIQKYPKSPSGIWMMVEKLSDFKSSVLRKYTMDLLDANGPELTRLPEYLPFLKKMVKFADPDRELGERLLDTYVSTQAHKTPTHRTSSGSSKLDEFATGASEIKFEGPIDHKSSSSLNLGLEPEHLQRLASAVYNSRLVIAIEDGWGTLTRQGTGRNRDFKFQAGELMLLSFDSAVNGHNNVVVYNSRGERGDIRRNYIKEIPPNMGAEKVSAVYVASGLPERTSGSSKRASEVSPVLRDREQRKNPSSSLYGRKRSRSPPLAVRQKTQSFNQN